MAEPLRNSGINFAIPSPSPRTTSPKRNRATTTTVDEPSLPPNRRPTTARTPKAPALKETTSFLFRGKNPLYSRHVIEERHDKMEIRCTQPGCKDMKYKEIDRAIHGTNNFKRHYQKFHPTIPLSDEEVKIQQKIGTHTLLLVAHCN